MARKFLILFVALLLAACGGNTPGTATQPASTTEPGDTGTTGSNEGTVELGETATSEDGTLTVQYPPGWFVNTGIGQITLANNEAMFSLEAGATPEADQVAVNIIGGSTDQLPVTGEDLTPAVLLQEFSGLLREESEVTLSEPEEFTVNGRNAASITGTQDTQEMVMVAAETENGSYVIVTLIGTAGAAERYRDTVRAIAGSATFNPDAGTPDVDMSTGADGGTEEADEAEPTEETTPES